MHRLVNQVVARRVWPLVAWTVLVWGSRLRNIWVDDDLDTGGQIGRTALALSLLIPALVVARLLWERRGSIVDGRARVVVLGFAAWTIAVWVVRGVQIGFADHDTSFKVVHTVLAAVSIGLAVYAVGRSAIRNR